MNTPSMIEFAVRKAEEIVQSLSPDARRGLDEAATLSLEEWAVLASIPTRATIYGLLTTAERADLARIHLKFGTKSLAERWVFCTITAELALALMVYEGHQIPAWN